MLKLDNLFTIIQIRDVAFKAETLNKEKDPGSILLLSLSFYFDNLFFFHIRLLFNDQNERDGEVVRLRFINGKFE